MTRRSFQSLLAMTALPSQRLLAEDATAILTHASEVFQSLKSYRFEGETVSETTIKGKSSRSATKFAVAFESPNRLRLEYVYPTAGNWVRISDGETMFESRSITKESRRTPANEWTLRILNSSPVANFEKLATTAQTPIVIRSEAIELNGKPTDCHVIQFESHRRTLSETEHPGPSLVWVAKDTGLILREEIRTTATSRGELTETKRTTSVQKLLINQNQTPETFAIARTK